METSRPHQNSLSSFPKGEFMLDFAKGTIPKCPLLFSTPLKKPCSQPAKKEGDGERCTSASKGNPKVTENLLGARINGANAHSSACSTPIKTPFGTSSQLQTPTSKLSVLSANANKHSVGASGGGMNEDAVIMRTPFRLLAGKNLNTCLFSPLHTPRSIAFPAQLDKLASPSLKGHAKRVLLIPPQLSPARRVPVKQKGSQQATAGKQSQFATPRSTKVDNVWLATPKSSRIDNAVKGSGQKGDSSNAIQHQDVCNVGTNSHKKDSERSTWSKSVLASTPQLPSLTTPNSSRAEHLLETAGRNNGVSGDKTTQHNDSNVEHGSAKLDKSKWLSRVLASMPQLSSPARRVPLPQKQKQPIKKPPPLHHREKQQPSNQKPSSENSKTCESGQRRKKTYQNEAGVMNAKRQTTQKSAKESLKRIPKGKGGSATDKMKQKNVNNCGIKGSSSKQHNEDIDKKYGGASVDAKGNDAKQSGEDGKQHEASDVDVGCGKYHNAEYDANDVKQHCDDDGSKHHANKIGENYKHKSGNGRDSDIKQEDDSCVNVSRDDDAKEHHGGSSECCDDDNGIEWHDHHDGDDDIGVKSDDVDHEHHGDDFGAKIEDMDGEKQQTHENDVKPQHNDNGGK